MNTALIKKSVPLILTIVGAVGVAATGVLSARAGMKAERAIAKEKRSRDVLSTEVEIEAAAEAKEEGLTVTARNVSLKPTISRKEAMKLTWKYYIPPVLAGLLTIGAIIFSHRLSTKEIAALTGTCAYLAANRDMLEEKIREHYGEEALGDIYDEIGESLLARSANGKISVEETGQGDVLCFEGYSGRWFRSSPEAVQAAEERFNDRFDGGEYLSLNDLYDELGISQTHFGNEFGYAANPDYYDAPIIFENVLLTEGELTADPGEPVYVIEILTYPMQCWLEV